MGHVIDHEAERADLIVRAHDAQRTPGEQAAIDEAERLDSLAADHEKRGATADAAALRKSAQEWRDLALRAREEDLLARAARKTGRP